MKQLLVVCALLAGLTYGHHSMAGFDRAKTVTLAGTIKQFKWANPHSWIEMEVPNDKGEVVTWNVEMTAPGILAKAGWKSTTLKPGDKVTISARPLLTGEPGALFVSVKLANGDVFTERAPAASAVQTKQSGALMIKSIYGLIVGLTAGVALFAVFALEAQQGQAGKNLTWAYPVPDKAPPGEADKGPKKIPGSTRSFTQAQIDDQFNPPDWFPEEHGPLPKVVQTGIQAQACGSCHLMSGHGHPESATLAGLPVQYMLRQMADFKNGERKDPMIHAASQRAARMNNIAAGLPEDDMKKAVEFFAAMKPAKWYRVVEAATVPKTWINGGRMRLPLPGGETEPLGNRIITLPEDPARVESRDPHSGFIAYVPAGSIKKGEALVTTGGGGKTLQCAICHGEGLKGLGDIPRLANIHPIYIVRQLYNFQTGANTSSAAALMKKVVEKLTEDDMIAIAAYTGSLAP